jgi:HEAT repeat protein
MREESIDELFSVALLGDENDDVAWDAVTKLHLIGSQEVLEKAIALTHSENEYYRARGANIIGQLGVQSGIASTSFIPERLQAALDLLRSETAILPLTSAISAIGHIGQEQGILEILPFRNHPNRNVRWYVAMSLGGHDIPEIVSALMELMHDAEPRVRDWATFGIGARLDADSDAIRDALFERLQDEDCDTRGEAAVGLAKRKDLRVLPFVIDELLREEHGDLYEEAAQYLLGFDAVDTDGWDSLRYVEELRSRFNLRDQTISE